MDLKEWILANLSDCKQKDPNIVARCPKCHVNNGQFAVNFVTGAFQCKRETCGLKGTRVAYLISVVEEISYREAAEKYGFDINTSKLDLLTQKILKPIKSLDSDSIPLPDRFVKFGTNEVIETRFLTYLHNRQITDKTIKDLGLGYCTMGPYQERIIVPINTVNFSGFTSRTILNDPNIPRYKNEPGEWKYKSLLGFNEFIKTFDNNQLIICEGPFDYLSLYTKGFGNIALQGVSLDDAQIIILKNNLPKTCKIVLMLDPEVNHSVINDICSRLYYYFNVFVAKLPLGKDPGDATYEEITKALILAKRWNGNI